MINRDKIGQVKKVYKNQMTTLKEKQVELSSAKLRSLSWVEAEIEFDLVWWLKHLKSSVEVFEVYHTTSIELKVEPALSLFVPLMLSSSTPTGVSD